jgi:hypothetical protein
MVFQKFKIVQFERSKKDVEKQIMKTQKNGKIGRPRSVCCSPHTSTGRQARGYSRHHHPEAVLNVGIIR